MSEQELDLLQLSTGEMTQAGATTAEVVRCQVCDVGASGRALHDKPYRFRRDVFAPDSSGSADCPKDEPGGDSGSVRPVIHRAFHPGRHWNRSDVLSLADQVGYTPVLLPDLQVGDPEPNQLRAPEAAADQNCQNTPITLSAETIVSVRATASFFVGAVLMKWERGPEASSKEASAAPESGGGRSTGGGV